MIATATICVDTVIGLSAIEESSIDLMAHARKEAERKLEALAAEDGREVVHFRHTTQHREAHVTVYGYQHERIDLRSVAYTVPA